MTFPSYGPPQQPEPPKRKNRGKTFALTGAAVLGVVVIASALSGGNDRAPTPATPSASPTRVVEASAPPQAAPTTTIAPTPAPVAAPAGPATTASEGVYQVGTDLAAGRYKTTGPDKSDYVPSCYWERATDDSGELNAIIANDNISGPGSLTLKSGEFIKFSGSCIWTKA